MVNPRSVASSGRPVLLLCAVILVLYFAREVLIPLALALTISFLLNPVVMALEKWKIGRLPAVALVTLSFVGCTGVLSWVVGGQLVDVLADLPQYRVNIHNKIAALHAPSVGTLGKVSATVKEIGQELSQPATNESTPDGVSAAQPSVASELPSRAPLPVQVVPPPSSDIQYLGDLLMPMLKPLAMVVVVLVFTIFILIKREDLRNRVLRLVGLGQLNLMTQALDDGTKRIGRYLMMQFLVNVAYGVLFGLGLFAIGVPNALLWAAIAALLRIVPYVGTLVAALLPTLLALSVFHGWQEPVLVLVLYLILEGVTGNFVEPWLYGAHTGISSLALLVATVFWTLLWGWAGLILSTPLTVCLIVLGRYAPQWSFLHVLLGDEAPLAPHAHYYQRLLAMDQLEARAVAEDYLKGKPLVKLYDDVLLPALSLAEQDRHKGTLDEARGDFLLLSATELISELAEYEPTIEREVSEDGVIKWEPNHTTQTTNSNRVICIPASDQADEVVAVMLAQLLEQSNHGTILLPLNASIYEALTAMEVSALDTICISAVPPFAFSHARSLCQGLRTRYPHAKILVGLWSFTGDTEKALARFGRMRPDSLQTTLAGAIEQIVEWNTADVSAEQQPVTSNQ